MGFWSFLKVAEKKEQREAEKWDLEKEFLREKQEAKLEYEKRRKDIEFITIEKRQKLEQMKLDYEIANQEAMIEEDFGEETEGELAGNSEDQLLSQILTKIIDKNSNNNPIVSSSSEDQYYAHTPTITQSIDLSDEEINNIIDNLDPKYLKMAKIMSSGQIKSFIKNKYPTISEKSLNRGLIILKTK